MKKPENIVDSDWNNRSRHEQRSIKRAAKYIPRALKTGRSLIESAEGQRFAYTDRPLPSRERVFDFPHDLTLDRPHTPLPEVTIEPVQE